MKLTELIKKGALDKQSEKFLGNITNVCWQKGCFCLVEIDGECFSADKIDQKESIRLQNATQALPLPPLLEKFAYDNNGMFLGKVVDCQLTSALKLKNIWLDNGKILAVGKLACNGDVILTRNLQQKPKTKKIAQTPKQQPTPSAPVQPRRRYGDFSFLIGKQVDKNILNFLGETMIKRGEIITAEVYLQAKKFGKLTELCLHAE